LTAFGVEAALHGSTSGSGRTSGFLHHERISQPQPQPIEGQSPVAQLGSFIIGRNNHRGTQFLHQTIALPLGQRGGGLDIETDLRPGVSTIGVLSTGASARTEPPFEFGHSNDDTRRHSQSILGSVHHPSLGVMALYAADMNGQEWIATFANELGLEPLDDAEIEALLDLAGVAAHASERLAAPLTCYLVAKAGITPSDALARARILAGS